MSNQKPTTPTTQTEDAIQPSQFTKEQLNELQTIDCRHQSEFLKKINVQLEKIETMLCNNARNLSIDFYKYHLELQAKKFELEKNILAYSFLKNKKN